MDNLKAELTLKKTNRRREAERGVPMLTNAENHSTVTVLSESYHDVQFSEMFKADSAADSGSLPVGLAG